MVAVRPAAACIALLALALGASGCGGGAPAERTAGPEQGAQRQGTAPSPGSRSRPAQTRAPCPPGTRRRLGDRRLAFAAVALRPTRAFRLPGRRPFASFGLRNVNGHRTVLGVLGVVLDRSCRPGWYRVQLPLRPNGTTGYVRARDVALEPVPTRIEVDLSERRLTFYRLGKPVLRAAAGVGAPRTPTPTGRFYVNQRLIPADPHGPFGPGAIGISAFSEVLRDWPQGGPIAIHGTDAPWSVGRAFSNGCIRLQNRVLRRLFAATPAGTPVVIRA